AARDLDALRFRADTEINQAIRGVAEDTGVPLLDAAQRFLDGTEEIPELPGYRLFHEHVHFNFAGNYALASAAHQHLASRLDSAPSANPRAQLTQQQVAERLAFTRFDELELERDILRLVSRPPFTDDPAQDADVARRWQHLAELEAGLDAASWSQTEKLYLQRLDTHPLDLETRRRFAGLLQARQPEASISHWRFLLDRIPHHGRWRTSLALALADSGQTEAALAELRTVEQRQGVSADSLVNRGTVLETSGDDKAAEATYRRAVELDPRHTLARFNLATAALRRGACDEAIRRYRQLLEREADFAPAHHNLGRCHERQGELEAATLAYRDAIRADPGFASAYNSLGLALEQQGEEAAALAAYRNAVAYRQEFALAHFNLADLLWSQGKHAEAANAYERGLSYRPDNPQARYNRAGALMAAGDEVEAAAELAKVVDQRGEPGELHNLAWILATSERPELRDPQRAVELAERAARATRRQSAEILETLAAAYGAAGRRDDATATLHSAASLARAQGRHGLANRLERRLRGRR
ncbi:MAG: tetratricopeptide repeat protein, partial [Acidobacteriota bacterium]